MVLIITESTDDSTNGVIDWLKHWGKPFIRLNRDEFFFNDDKGFSLELTSEASLFSFFQKKLLIPFDDIKSIWFRRSIYPYLDGKLDEIKEETYYGNVARNFYYEYLNVSLTFFSLIDRDKRVLGNFRSSRFNKIEILNLAKEAGIDIPATLLTNKKEKVKQFLETHKYLITKAVSDVFHFDVAYKGVSERYLNYTEEVTKEILESWPEDFFYSLFQEKLNKEFEIRTFFIDGHFFSMAIFSQLDKQTSIDFRKYSNNRRIPFKLPDTLTKKLTILMNSLNFNCGSIDFVKTQDGRFVFLEVNPTGQYGMTSYPCNYYLDKKICDFFLNDDNGR